MAAAEVPRHAQPGLGEDFLTVEVFDRDRLEALHVEADNMQRFAQQVGDTDLLSGSHYWTVFWDSPSTRTKSSFELAVSRLGGTAHTFDQSTSSSNKGETFGETIEQLDSMLVPGRDGFIVRVKESGGVKAAADLADAPVFNAGDGADGEHPSQGLLDTQTMRRRAMFAGGLANSKTVFFGDLRRARTVKSTAKLAAIAGQRRQAFVAPHPSLSMPDETLEWLRDYGVEVEVADDLRDVAHSADFVYAVRTQVEHMTAEEKAAYKALGSICMITPDMLRGSNAVIMHPYPQDKEDLNIHPELRWDPRCIVKEQAGHGVWTRMALLATYAGKTILDDPRAFDLRLQQSRGLATRPMVPNLV